MSDTRIKIIADDRVPPDEAWFVRRVGYQLAQSWDAERKVLRIGIEEVSECVGKIVNLPASSPDRSEPT